MSATVCLSIDTSLKVDPHLRVLDASGAPIPDVFALGDNSTPEDGHRLPATAQVASQMAGWMSSTLKSLGQGGSIADVKPFAWKDRGSMVFIGDYRAMVDRSKSTDEGPRARLNGLVAWVVWRSYYMTLAMGWRNKVSPGRGERGAGHAEGEVRDELMPDPHSRVLGTGLLLRPRCVEFLSRGVHEMYEDRLWCGIAGLSATLRVPTPCTTVHPRLIYALLPRTTESLCC